MTPHAALAAASFPREVDFGATVTSKPRFFYGSNTHAMHEAFTCRADDGTALEIVDNIKLAPPVPVAPGDRIDVRGELVRDRKTDGPLVHWTHHDPAQRHVGGYIDFAGRRYA